MFSVRKKLSLGLRVLRLEPLSQTVKNKRPWWRLLSWMRNAFIIAPPALPTVDKAIYSHFALPADRPAGSSYIQLQLFSGSSRWPAAWLGWPAEPASAELLATLLVMSLDEVEQDRVLSFLHLKSDDRKNEINIFRIFGPVVCVEIPK
ncbi:hypothetical protein DL96DRAFT_1679393 [Flagelloscypha sp. PMI_526]|nr:hypothetical protein DL96DRAFT_1679393 [Flagelloscypha sp. PMI_526]